MTGAGRYTDPTRKYAAIPRYLSKPAEQMPSRSPLPANEELGRENPLGFGWCRPTDRNSHALGSQVAWNTHITQHQSDS